MFNSYTFHTVDKTVYLDKIFEYIPAKAFIHKGRCGIGGTTLELLNTNRCSIIIAPTLGILNDKKKSHPDLFLVHGEVKLEAIIKQLALNLPAQKIMCTPDSIRKIVTAAHKLKTYDEMKQNWFLLLDECHTYITEVFRKNMLRPFRYFWDFPNKAVISATPYMFSDERFVAFDYFKIEFTSTLGLINLVNCISVQGTLNDVILQSLPQSGKVFIFLNSVTEIVKTIHRAGIKDLSSIYCANDEQKENLTKLDDLVDRFFEQPDENNFSKFNFFTGRYFEGWDLFAEDANIILVTDFRVPHTMVSVGMKLKQAAGRLRGEASNIIHLTNTRNIQSPPKCLEELKSAFDRDAQLALEQYNIRKASRLRDGLKLEQDSCLDKYADYEFKTRIATINKTKIDQQVNQAYTEETYNNINLIRQEWENGYYDVVLHNSDKVVTTPTAMKRKSKAKQLEEDYKTILAYKEQNIEALQFHFGQTPEEKVRESNPLAYHAAQLLSEATMESLGYNVKRVQEEVIVASNTLHELKLLRLVNSVFKIGIKYSNDDIATKLTRIYTQLDIRDPKTNTIKKANSKQLEQPGWFDIEDCKLPDKNGKYTIHGYVIVRSHFNMRIAA